MGIVQKLKEMLSQRARSTQYLAEIAAGSDNEQRLINEKLTETVVVLTEISNLLRSKLDAVIAGSNQQQKLLNDKLSATIAQLNDVSNVMRTRLDAVVGALDNQTKVV